MLGELLTVEEIETSRSAPELQVWIDLVLQRALLPQHKETALLRKKLAKEFYQEVYPLNFLIQHLFFNREDVICTPKIGSQGYDAVLEISGKKKFDVEITFNHDGEKENLDMQYFIEHGKVSFTGKTERIKSDNGKSKIVNTSVAKYASEIKAEVYKFIKDALKNKSKNRYGTGCLLIIAFEDHIGFRGDKDKNELLEFADKELDCSSLEFEAIYLVGMSGKNIIPVKKLVV